MKKANLDIERCKSCELCLGVCKQKAIKMTDNINSRGYKHISLDEDACIGCGLCYVVCPDGVFTIVEV
jgi:2-oxoglutarate ferredoxin oxidoreductase subunit delta